MAQYLSFLNNSSDLQSYTVGVKKKKNPSTNLIGQQGCPSPHVVATSRSRNYWISCKRKRTTLKSEEIRFYLKWKSLTSRGNNWESFYLLRITKKVMHLFGQTGQGVDTVADDSNPGPFIASADETSHGWQGVRWTFDNVKCATIRKCGSSISCFYPLNLDQAHRDTSPKVSCEQSLRTTTTSGVGDWDRIRARVWCSRLSWDRAMCTMCRRSDRVYVPRVNFLSFGVLILTRFDSPRTWEGYMITYTFPKREGFLSVHLCTRRPNQLQPVHVQFQFSFGHHLFNQFRPMKIHSRCSIEVCSTSLSLQ